MEIKEDGKTEDEKERKIYVQKERQKDVPREGSKKDGKKERGRE